MPECEFKKVALHVFKTPFHKKISGGLLLLIISSLRLSLSLSCHIYIYCIGGYLDEFQCSWYEYVICNSYLWLVWIDTIELVKLFLVLNEIFRWVYFYVKQGICLGRNMQPPEVFYKKVFIKISQNSQETGLGKHLCQSLFFNKVAGLRPAILLIKRLRHICFPMKFGKFLRTLFYKKLPDDHFLM